jgi:Flp pilus assembly protein TadD
MSLLLEALKRAERAKRQQAEAAETPKLEVVMTTPPADEAPPVAQEEPTLATGAPHLELDLSGLEAFEATLASDRAAPTQAPELLAEAASLPSIQEDATPLEFSLPPAELPPMPGDNSLDFPAIEWSLPEEKSSEQAANIAPIDTPPEVEAPLAPEKGDSITLAPLALEETAPLTISEPQPLPEPGQETPPEEAVSKESATAPAALSLESVAASGTEKAAQAAEQSEKKTLGASLEEARNKARRLLGKPAPAVPEAPPPSRFSRRQLTLLSLLLAATTIGAAGTYYAWLQMTPAPLLTATGSPPPAASSAADGNTVVNAPAATQEPASDLAPALPQAQESAPAPTKELADNAAKALAQQPLQPPVADTVPAAAAGPISIVRNPPRIDVLDESVRQGFAAYDRGDYHNARLQYQKASKADPRNRQAMLGLAATEEAAGNSSAAASLYAQALALDPRDPVAQAALLNLTTADPSQGESKLRLLLTEQPDRSFLHFALGNVLAAQQRWPEAEQAYFRASTLDSNNPDFAFNLAISLDQLHQRQPAREHYQRALELAGKRPARFDRQSARLRLEQLSAQP